MKKFFYLLLILLAACTSEKANNDPVSVTKAYMHAMNEGNFKKAKKYLAKDFLRQIENAEQQAKQNPGAKTNVQIIDEHYELRIDRDSVAQVTMGAKVKDDDIGLAYVVWLRKEDGIWLINEVISRDF